MPSACRVASSTRPWPGSFLMRWNWISAFFVLEPKFPSTCSLRVDLSWAFKASCNFLFHAILPRLSFLRSSLAWVANLSRSFLPSARVFSSRARDSAVKGLALEPSPPLAALASAVAPDAYGSGEGGGAAFDRAFRDASGYRKSAHE